MSGYGACDLQPFSELQGGEESFPKGRDDGQTKTTAVHLIMRPLVVWYTGIPL